MYEIKKKGDKCQLIIKLANVSLDGEWINEEYSKLRKEEARLRSAEKLAYEYARMQYEREFSLCDEFTTILGLIVLYIHIIYINITKLHKIISVTIPKEILAKLDKARGDIPRSRYLLRLIQRQLVVNKI